MREMQKEKIKKRFAYEKGTQNANAQKKATRA